MKKIAVIMIGLLTVCTMVFAGGQQGGKNSGDAPVRFIVQESDISYIRSAVNKFMADNPSIKVELVMAPDFDTMKRNVLASNQAGDDFDLMYVNHVDTLAFIKGDIIQPLDKFAQADGIKYETIIFESLLEACKFNGELYSIPINTDTRVLAVNKEMFSQAGLAYPKTQAEMLQAAAKLTGGSRYGYVNSMTRSAYVPEYEQGVFLMGNGGRLYQIQNGKAVATIDTREMRDYLNFNLELLKYMPANSLTMSENEGRAAFASGNVGMYIFGPWEYTLLPEKLPFTYELIKIPAGSKESASTSGGYQLAIGKGSKNPQAAWQLLKYLTTDAEIMALAGGTGLPTSSAAYNVAPFTDPKYNIFKEQLNTSYVPEIPVANLSEVVTEFDTYWKDLLYKKITVEEACVNAQKSVQALLDITNK
jgi:multiple sugar transport system substrate-binding protein